MWVSLTQKPAPGVGSHPRHLVTQGAPARPTRKCAQPVSLRAGPQGTPGTLRASFLPAGGPLRCLCPAGRPWAVTSRPRASACGPARERPARVTPAASSLPSRCRARPAEAPPPAPYRCVWPDLWSCWCPSLSSSSSSSVWCRVWEELGGSLGEGRAPQPESGHPCPGAADKVPQARA